MAATLFIIKIPNEKREFAPDEFKDDKNKMDIPGVIKNSSRNCSEETASNVSDLETDASKVEKKDSITQTILSKDSSENINKTNEFTNNEDIFSEPMISPNVNEGKTGKECSSNESTEEINSPLETLSPRVPEVTMLDFITKEPLETQLQNLLESMSIKNVNWSNVEGCKQALFIESGDPIKVEEILENLMSIGIGQKIVGSSVSLFPATVHIENTDVNKEDDSLLNLQKENENEFKNSVKSRMIVAQVVQIVRSNAVFTFDYCMLIILASVISVIGLIENSSVILVASMLISPLMGPILAGTFGITIRNSPLRNLGIRSECIGLTLCIICGFIGGLLVGAIQHQGLTGYMDEWPTMEMKSRGMSRSLWIGVFIALPSGAGVSLSILGGNIGSLVGVAISASLLPPAVNAGMLWAFALLTIISPLEYVSLNNSSTVSVSELGCLPFQDNAYEPIYSCNMTKEMGIMGAVSLLLTFINIICIFFVGVIMLKIKEVLPLTSSENTVEFWGSDLKVARDSYKTMKGSESAFLHQKFKNEWEKLTKSNQRKENSMKRNNIHFERILQDISTSLPYNPYWTLPYKLQSSEENQTAHTIHSLSHSKVCNYETIIPSPDILMARPFSFPNYKEEVPTKKSKKHKKIRFTPTIVKTKKNKFIVTSVPESTLLKASIDEEML